MDLSGRVTVLTGASRGLGVEVAKALAERGARLALAARSKDALEGVRDQVTAIGAEAVAIATDVTSSEDRARLVKETEAALGPIDILVNNAGIESTGAFDRLEPSAIGHRREPHVRAAPHP